MNKRDSNILDSLKTFRVLDRDQIIELHFQKVKDPVSSCNKVLKRLQRDGHIDCDMSRRPFYYFPKPLPIKKDSSKLPHFHRIADFIIGVSKIGVLSEFIVEPKVGGKGTVEPDIYMVWNKAPFFIEIQRNVYTKKVMDKKIDRYKEYFNSGDWKENGQYFPYLWIVTDHTYKLDTAPLRVFQTKDVDEFANKYIKKKES